MTTTTSIYMNSALQSKTRRMYYICPAFSFLLYRSQTKEKGGKKGGGVFTLEKRVPEKQQKRADQQQAQSLDPLGPFFFPNF